MKIFIIPFLLISASLYGQVMTFDQSQDLNFTVNYANGDTLSKYIMKDGSEIIVGGQLKFGKPLNENKVFTRLFFGEVNLLKALLSPPIQLSDVYIGEEVTITSIRVGHTKISKNSPLVISLYVQNPKSPLGAKNRTVADIEKAIETGEIINPNAAMTREQAIAKLKESKELLDLGMMPQEEYDALKLKLTPIIMKQ
jgi:hypothetical protein